MNPARVSFVMDTLTSGGAVERKYMPLSSPLRFLDIGSGGGILLESFLRLGLPPSQLTSVEPSAALCGAMKSRLEGSGLGSGMTVHNGLIETLPKTEPADVVTALEVIEHVPLEGRKLFIDSMLDNLAPGGHIFLSTMDQDVETYLRCIVGAEYIAQVTPVGTHSYDLFMPPQSLADSFVRDEVSLVKVSKLLPKGGLLGEIKTYGLKKQGGEWMVGKEENVDCVTRQAGESDESVRERIGKAGGWGNYVICFKKAGGEEEEEKNERLAV
jgi:ubiquinone biosynthesis O-methyltransferase